jgi:ATP-dependent RNA helicase DDX19/DBP5
MDPSTSVDQLSKDFSKASVDGDKPEVVGEDEDVEDKRLVSRSIGFQDSTAEATVLESAGQEDDPLKSAVTSFIDLNLNENILRGVYAVGFKNPSKIQGLAIPAILKRPASNFIGQAQSGTGKTGAFCLSMLASVDEAKKWPQAIVLSPTRELCRQTFEVMAKFARFTAIRPLLVIPEADIPAKIENQVLVCTPGKLEGLVKRRSVDLKRVVMFVLDEADEMLGQPGQENASLKLHKKLPKTCQMCLFSATYNERVSKFAHELVPAPRTSILIPAEKLSLIRLIQYYINCESETNKFNCLDKIFKTFSVGQSIIFVQTKKTAQLLEKRMKEATHEVALLIGDMKESERDRVMDGFRAGNDRILITTNVLARGVDVLQVSLVVNYDLPVSHLNPNQPECETYLHRIGRSARYGNSGIAINFVHDARSLEIVKKIEGHFNRQIQELRYCDLPRVAELLEQIL